MIQVMHCCVTTRWQCAGSPIGGSVHALYDVFWCFWHNLVFECNNQKIFKLVFSSEIFFFKLCVKTHKVLAIKQEQHFYIKVLHLHIINPCMNINGLKTLLYLAYSFSWHLLDLDSVHVNKIKLYVKISHEGNDWMNKVKVDGETLVDI